MLHLLGIPELDPRAFSPSAGRMRLYGGKGDAPATPDYQGAAEATAAGNLEAARAATSANRINQYTPWGSLTYSQTPQSTVDYAAYNKALEAYNNQQQNLSQGTSTNPLSRGLLGGLGLAKTGSTLGGTQATLSRPQIEDFTTYNPDSGWSQTLNLTPEAQQALDEQLALNRKYGEVANIGFDKVRSIFENPELDTSVLPERAINVGQTAQEAILSRLNPQLAQQEEALRTRLANQGITLGSDAYNREMALQSQRANDLQTQAALQGITLDQANRATALQEQAYLQDRPLNLINALRSGNQVATPQFQQFAQQATTQGADVLGATNAQYNADLNAYNAQQASNAGLASGLFGIGTSLMGLPTVGGGSLGGNILSSWMS